MRLHKSAFFMYVILTMIMLWSCRELSSPVRSEQDSEDQPVATLDLTGMWQGKIEGTHPYFKGNPTVNMELDQLSYVLRGIIRTSDGAFKNDTLKQGVSLDSTINFAVRETNYYTNEVLTFSGRYRDDRISGYWYNSVRDSSSWYAIRIR